MSKVNLFNIDLKLIPDDVIINIAKDLGCNIKEPIKEVNNYTVDIVNYLTLRNTNSLALRELLRAEVIEERKIRKEYMEKKIAYFDEVNKWLIDNNYMMELE